jgi:hypothetical protein
MDVWPVEFILSDVCLKPAAMTSTHLRSELSTP